MPKIENCSWDDVKHGWHTDFGPNTVLIQIADPATFFPEPKKKFKKISQFEFLDAEEDDKKFDEDFKIQTWQAHAIVLELKYALLMNYNVIVHCHAGICRSGAVVEVGLMLGFEPTNRFRNPNTLVKKKLMEAAGLLINEKTSAFNEV